MNETVEKCIENMNKIQAKVYVLEPITKAEKQIWKAMCRRIRELGFKPSSKKVNGRSVWYAKPIEETRTARRNHECAYEYLNVRPTDRKTLQGDCTTRAMCAAFCGKMTYTEIENRQYALARECGTRRNTSGTWEIILRENGFWKINISRVKLAKVAKALNGVLNYPIVAVVPQHATVIDVGGIVKDLWDCRGRSCKYIFVKKEDAEIISEYLNDAFITNKVDNTTYYRRTF